MVSGIDGGAHGKRSPAGSFITAPRASSLITAPSAPSTMSDGIPETLKSDERACRAERFAYGSASHGIDAKYPANSSGVLSDETNTIARRSLSRSNVAASLGVKALQGGHQCAEKYNATAVFPARASARGTSPDFDSREGPRRSRGFWAAIDGELG
eukprot:Amastigsp_a174521_437.p2 type:complete len:156 gc:universal Amastigsp_a174521_437:493-26(-)